MLKVMKLTVIWASLTQQNNLKIRFGGLDEQYFLKYSSFETFFLVREYF